MTSALDKILAEAVAAHRQGDLARAEALYRQVLAASAANFHALHLLGVLEAQRRNFAAAALFLGRAVTIDPKSGAAHLNHGNVLRELKRGGEALAAFDRALALGDDAADAWISRGVTLQEMKRRDEALESFDRALAAKPGYAEAWSNRGNALNELGRRDEALASYDRALSIKPDSVEALSNRGAVLHDLRRYAEAADSHRRAIELAPGFADAHFNLGNTLKKLGRPHAAAACHARAIGLMPSHDAAWVAFSEYLRDADALDERYLPLLPTALTRGNLDPQNAERVAVRAIRREPLAGELLALADDPDSCARRLEELIENGGLKPLTEAPLLLAVLEETIVTDYRLEKLLTVLRRVLLSLASRAHRALEEKPMLRFAGALALQCFANDYVWTETDEERRQVDELARRSASASPASIAVIGAYEPLHRFDFAPPTDAELRALIERQVAEPKKEAELKKEIQRLTRIGDKVSQDVRAQYEENPYPRWRRKSAPADGKPIHAVLRELFPHAPAPAASPERPEILVAGCGTGAVSIQTLRRFQNSRILAVDLSLSSLAYAKRTAAEAGIADIDYAQADILALSALGRRFDLIECSGVLHHLRDPLAGWRVLTDLLRPGGHMILGLYSRRARRDITRVQQFIRERGIPATPKCIRQARQAIMAGEAGAALTGVTAADFYNLSTCRDLLFHVQEHVFTPLEIKSCLDRLGLRFLGFELWNPATEAAYRARFPDDQALLSLDNWEAFEADNPAAFIHMYQFWARKG